ncbi:MAG: substrate-binding domain-containing protein [Erysipelotrichaceae bacterium]
MKKLLSLLAVAMLATACSGGGDTTDEVVVGATIYKFDDNFMSVVRQNMTNYASEIGVTLNLVDSQNDQQKQGEQVDTMIADGVSVLAINLVDPAAAPTIIQKAKDADLSVVFYNKEPDASAINSYDKAYYVGTNSAESGTIQGELITKGWNENMEAWDKNGDGKIQYVLLKGEIGHPDAEARTTEAQKALAAIGAEELALESATWDGTKANEIMTTWLSAFDNIEMVVANNDGMALGAINALKADGYFSDDKYMPVFGVDAIAEALDAIEAGTMYGTVLNDAVNQAKATLDLAKNLAEGKGATEGTSWTLDSVKAVRVPYVGVDGSNYTEFR